MSVLGAIAARYTTLDDAEVGHLHRLLSEWQILSDLAFADCLLFAPVSGHDDLVVLAQVRPYPAQTLYPDDMIGVVLPAAQRPRVVTAFAERRIVREGDPEWVEGTPVRREAIPVVRGGRVIAVIGLDQNLATARTPSHLEISYLRAAGDLQRMIAEGTFPSEEEEDGERELSPRVGDGFLHLTPSFEVAYASPNAVSAYRRIGVNTNLVGERIDRLGPDERALLATLRAGRLFESEMEHAGAVVIRRFIPIVHGGEAHGAIGLMRDITELRRRDRMLLIKDATIREIHHRVKNNLQMVASLLRLQARRLGTSEARAKLEESVRRIASIALVHETLSQDASDSVGFDRVAAQVLEMVASTLQRPDRPVRTTIEGTAGDLPSEIATPLSLVLAELIQNALEHAFVARGGTVAVTLAREEQALRVIVRDDGVGLPAGFALEERSGLGLEITRTLIEEELGGSIALRANGGTVVEIEVPVVRG